MLLVSDENVPNGRSIIEGIVDADRMAAGHAEDEANAFRLQNLDDRLPGANRTYDRRHDARAEQVRAILKSFFTKAPSRAFSDVRGRGPRVRSSCLGCIADLGLPCNDQ